MTRARRIVLLAAAGLLLSCGDGLEPPTTGSIALNIQLDLPPSLTSVPAMAETGTGTAVTGDSAVRSDAVKPASGSEVRVDFGVAAFTSARARTVGPTTKGIDLQLVDNFWEGTLDGLAPGSYSVIVEGLVNGEISARGATSNLTVTAGNATQATVNLTGFVPTLAVGIASPTRSLVIPVTVSAVTGADGYRVEWANNPAFTAPASKNITGGSGSFSVASVGTYYVRARALSGTTPGAPSTAATMDVLGDEPATGDNAASALALGFGTSVTQRLTKLNIAPAGDQDWFAVDACRRDTLIAETFATRLTPASELNSLLGVYLEGGGVLLDENDDITPGSLTDSRVQVVFPSDGRYVIRVASAGGATAGQYELELTFKGGPNVTGSSCAPITVVVSPATATINPGQQQQFTVSAVDAGGVPVTGIKYLWVSSNTNVAVVDTNGIATGVGGGTSAITAVGLGEPGSAALTVTGAPLGTATQLAFVAQPTSTSAGTEFSPAVEVEIRDANGSLLSGARNAVTLAIASNPGGATLYGTKTVSANAGVARFTGLYMDKVGAGYTLTASAASLTGATSAGFTISPGAPTKLTFGQQPTNAQGNVIVAPAVTATISDAYNNVVTSATNAVTVDFGVNVWQFVTGTGATLLGTKTVNAAGGVATFSDVRVDMPGNGYTFVASATGLNGATSTPFAVNLTAQAVRTGLGSHTCAVTSGGTYCWGGGGNGQLGDGSGLPNTVVPRLVSGGLTFTQVTTGNQHSCGLTAAGAAYCWGYNGNGQLGNNSTGSTDAPVAVSGGLTFSSLRAGALHTCGVVGSALYCWGYDGNGQLGDDANYTNKLVPTQVAGGLSWASVSPGYYHTCGLTTGGSAYCWGWDGYGQLGNDANFTQQPTPVVVAGGGTWVSVSAAYYQTCAVNASQAGFCWGRNIYGTLGADTTVYPRNSNQPTPVSVVGGLTLSTIQTGFYHACGLTTTGSAYCWGRNSEGQLGDGTTVQDSPLRVAVTGGLTFNTLSGGGTHTCGRVGTAVWCWGANGEGQLGNGSFVNRNQPVQIVQ